MTRYIVLLNFTEQGIRNLRKSTTRAAAFAKAAAREGVTVETQLWTAGKYDGLLVLSGEETAILQTVSALAVAGNVRPQSLRAFNAEEFKSISG